SILGFIIGGGKYFVIFAVIITAFSNVKLLKSTMSNFEKNSLMYPYLLITGDFLIQLKPQDFIADKFDQNNSSNKQKIDINDTNHIKEGIKYD
ncbi:colicin V production protein, partial [sediment metagenome]